MNDESATDDTTETPPPPPGAAPPPGPAGPRRLRRSNSDRLIAGVCGGTADYFGIDPIIVRLGFVALMLLGGSGLAVYLIAWLVMPNAWEDESAALNALRGGRRAGGRSLLALALLIVGIVIFSGSLFWLPVFSDGLFLPLLILAAGVALLVWPTDATGRPAWRVDREELRAEREAIRSEWERERDAWRESHPDRDQGAWRHGYRRGYGADTAAGGSHAPPPGETPAGPAPEGPARPPKRDEPRARPFLGPLAVSLLLLFTGLTVFADRVGWWTLSPAVFLAICLIVIGTVLVVSAFIGRARGLIWLGVLVLPLAWLVTAADLTWWNGIGEYNVRVESIDDLEDTYRWGIGEFVLDLSDLDLDGNTHEVAVGLTVGQLTVWVPDTLEVDVDLDGRLGSAIVDADGERINNDGVDIALDRRVGDPDGGTLLIDADIGIGEAEIILCGTSGVPCP